MSARVTVTPDPFTLIDYSAADIAAIVEDVAALIGLPSNVEIQIDVDEELFAPLVGHMSDVVDGRIVIWISGANFEDNRRPRTFSPEQARPRPHVLPAARPGPPRSRVRRRPTRRRAQPGRARSLGRVRLRPGPASRPPRPPAGDDLRVPAPTRLQRHRRRRVRALVGDAVHHVRRRCRRSAPRPAPPPGTPRRSRSTSSARSSGGKFGRAPAGSARRRSSKRRRSRPLSQEAARQDRGRRWCRKDLSLVLMRAAGPPAGPCPA